MISALRCSEHEEFVFAVMSFIFMSMEVMLLILSSLIS